jgi:hypothetical protein
MSATDAKFTRRDLIRGSAAVGLASLIPLSALTACGGEEAKSCAAPPGLTPDERTKRSQFQYLEASADSTKKCSACTFYTPPAAGEFCGPCTLGLGAVNPEGTCISFAPKT